ncbi:flap endonuclease [Acrasis kona]|uniref:Flap endonuclease 1 n=1 Tax=Acrasis kona TaxID=1008807 RepID=A0AAW2Z8S4_9EUKA
MGIKGLSTLIADTCPDAMKEHPIKSYFSRNIAIDASMCMYQFLIGIRGAGIGDLTNEAGEITSHLQGLLSRTIKLLELGIKPVYVFDGKAPDLKSGELDKRKEKLKEAKEELEKAEENGDDEAKNMYFKRTVRVTRDQADEAKKMLKLMGIPVIEAPSEAEAQCAELVKTGKVFATGTEDMDALTFGTSILLRQLTNPEGKVREYNLEKILEGMDITMDQFIDICILCGCDYTDSIKGIGPKKALQYVKKYKDIEGVIKNMPAQHKVPDNFPLERVREIFKQPEVIKGDEVDLKWTEVDEKGLTEFLVTGKKFNETRIANAIDKLRASQKQASQGRLDSFFQVVGKSTSSTLEKNKKAAELAKKKGKKGASSAAAKNKAGSGTKRKREEGSSSSKKLKKE